VHGLDGEAGAVEEAEELEFGREGRWGGEEGAGDEVLEVTALI
jgi:hypothetical protein